MRQTLAGGWAVAVACALSAFGCSLVRDADDVIVGEGVDAAEDVSVDAPASDAALDSSVDSSLDSTVDSSGEASVDSADSSIADTRVLETTVDAVVVDAFEAGPPLDRTWAQWRMPSVMPPGYTQTPDVVTDTTTGLRWQRVVGAAASYDQAAAACAALTLEGKSDYRLPTRIELISILAIAKGVRPAINASAFPGTPQERFWTASVAASGRFVVDFTNAFVKTALGSEPYRYRCVAPSP